MAGWKPVQESGPRKKSKPNSKNAGAEHTLVGTTVWVPRRVAVGFCFLATLAKFAFENFEGFSLV
jgi:hypothetical protein